MTQRSGVSGGTSASSQRPLTANRAMVSPPFRGVSATARARNDGTTPERRSMPRGGENLPQERAAALQPRFIDAVSQAGARERLDRHPGRSQTLLGHRHCLKRHDLVAVAVNEQHRRPAANLLRQTFGADERARKPQNARERFSTA